MHALNMLMYREKVPRQHACTFHDETRLLVHTYTHNTVDESDQPVYSLIVVSEKSLPYVSTTYLVCNIVVSEKSLPYVTTTYTCVQHRSIGEEPAIRDNTIHLCATL